VDACAIGSVGTLTSAITAPTIKERGDARSSRGTRVDRWDDADLMAQMELMSTQSPEAIAAGLWDLIRQEKRLGGPNLAGYYPVLSGEADSSGFAVYLMRRLDGRLQPRSGVGAGANGVIERRTDGSRVVVTWRSPWPGLWCHALVGLGLLLGGMLTVAMSIVGGRHDAALGLILGIAVTAGGVAAIAQGRHRVTVDRRILETALRRLLD
jgi:hypothetical protein